MGFFKTQKGRVLDCRVHDTQCSKCGKPLNGKSAAIVPIVCDACYEQERQARVVEREGQVK